VAFAVHLGQHGGEVSVAQDRRYPPPPGWVSSPSVLAAISNN